MEIKGFGSVVQLDKSKTRYKCRKWRLQVETTEGRKQKRFSGSLSEAKQALDEFVEDVEQNRVQLDNTFNIFADYWLNTRKSSKAFSPNTISTNERSVRTLKRLFNNEKLSDITPKEIREKIYLLTKEDTDQPTSNWHKVKILDTLTLIFKLAIDDGTLVANPCLKVKKPKVEKSTRRALNKKEFNKVLTCLSKEKKDGRQIAIYSILYLGLRRGEACTLKWKDYDAKKGTLKIQRAWKEGNYTIGETKSSAGNRILPMPKQLKEIFNEWKEIYQPTPKADDFICVNCFGDVLRGVALYKYWQKFIQKYSLPYVKVHELRHTNLTIVARYMSPFDLQHYAGWSDLGPAKIYIHKDQTSMKNAIDQIDY